MSEKIKNKKFKEPINWSSFRLRSNTHTECKHNKKKEEEKEEEEETCLLQLNFNLNPS